MERKTFKANIASPMAKHTEVAEREPLDRNLPGLPRSVTFAKMVKARIGLSQMRQLFALALFAVAFNASADTLCGTIVDGGQFCYQNDQIVIVPGHFGQKAVKLEYNRLGVVAPLGQKFALLVECARPDRYARLGLNDSWADYIDNAQGFGVIWSLLDPICAAP